MQTRRQFVRAVALGAGASALQFAGMSGSAAGDDAAGCELPARKVPVIGQYDVVVCGGGPSGTAAALAARRAGLSVLVLEGQGQLGGAGVSGLVSEWLGGDNGGIFREFATETGKLGISRQSDWGPAFDPFAMAAYLDRKMSADGVEVLLHTQCLDVRVTGDRISHVVFVNKGGMQAVTGKAFVDATGDADIAAWSGCQVVKGRPEDNRMTPTSLVFHVDGVDETKLSGGFKQHGNRLLKLIEKLRAQGEWPFAYDRFITRKLNEDGVWMVNTIRLVGLDGTSGKDVSLGMVRGRDEAQRLMAIFRKHVPGYEKARIKAVATSLGVRETRRISAAHTMTLDDLVKWAADKTHYDDVIGYSTWAFDLPNPEKPSDNPGPGRKGLPRAKPVPYRVMLPRPVGNLICPGRCISVDRDMLGTLRVMSPCMAMGQAAGQAAKQVASDGVSFSGVDMKRLLRELASNGAHLDPPTVSG
jgi:hypothetical protein